MGGERLESPNPVVHANAAYFPGGNNAVHATGLSFALESGCLRFYLVIKNGLVNLMVMLPYPDLFHLLAQHRRPSTTLWEALCGAVRQRTYLDREIWVDQGQVPTDISLIISGAALAYRIDDHERKLIRLWETGDLILLAESGLTRQKSPVRVLFPVPTTVLELSNESLATLRRDSGEMHWYFDAFIAGELRHLQEHIAWLQSRTAAERIRDFRERHPELDRLLPEDDKASYLGMSRGWYNRQK